jgi:hypothetical protein
MNLINDNDDAQWPKVTVIGSHQVSKMVRDTEPYMQHLYLSCGHDFYNTYGDKHKIILRGDRVGCRTCFNLGRNNG